MADKNPNEYQTIKDMKFPSVNIFSEIWRIIILCRIKIVTSGTFVGYHKMYC
jgi:hypothetical protein